MTDALNPAALEAQIRDLGEDYPDGDAAQMVALEAAAMVCNYFAALEARVKELEAGIQAASAEIATVPLSWEKKYHWKDRLPRLSRELALLAKHTPDQP